MSTPHKGVSGLLVKLAALSLPILALVGFYLAKDPFRVTRRYDSYYERGNPGGVVLNREYVSMEVFLRRYPERQWDSFVFGNSRSLFYQAGDWAPLIHSPRIFHFDASAESIYGITRKLEFLERRRIPVRHALIVLDADTLRVVGNSRGHIFVKHPLLSGQGRVSYQLEFFKAFCSPAFLLAYLPYQFSHRVTDHEVLDDRPFDYDPRYNETRFDEYERLMETNVAAYYAPRSGFFYPRPPAEVVSPPVIGEPCKQLLGRISRVLARQRTDFRLAISPLYDQKRLNPSDLACLREAFGPDKVFDFSGINNLTSCRTNYYESSHYRPHVARRILAEMYAAKGPVIPTAVAGIVSAPPGARSPTSAGATSAPTDRGNDP